LKNDEFYISLVGEVFDGYTKVAINKSPVYIKHLNIRDQRYLQVYYEKYKQRAIERGVDTTEERTQQIMADGMWTDAEDQKIAALQFEIQNLKKTIKGVFLPSQQDAIKESLKERREELSDLVVKKQEVIGSTADDYALARSNDELLRFLLFKTPDIYLRVKTSMIFMGSPSLNYQFISFVSPYMAKCFLIFFKIHKIFPITLGTIPKS
jgi:hypothetical protein